MTEWNKMSIMERWGNKLCTSGKHLRIDSDFGITTCIRCSKIFTKPSGKKPTDEERKRYGLRPYQSLWTRGGILSYDEWNEINNKDEI